MDIRKLTMDDFEACMTLSEYAFQFVLNEEQIEKRREEFASHNVLGVYEDGQVGAKLQIIPFQTYIQGRSFAMGGIAGVATWPEYRRKGWVAGLLKFALEEMNRNKQSISFLHPFSFAFYRKYGWETYVEFKNYKLFTDQLPAKKPTSGTLRRGNPELSVLKEVYDTYAERYNGTLARNDAWWENSVYAKKGSQRAVYYDEAGLPQGYVLYEVKERKFTIGEMVHLNEEARQGLWTFIANHDSMIDEVTLKAPANDTLAFQLDNPRIQQEVTPYFMARIVSVEQFISQYPFASQDSPVQIQLEVEDAHAPWNEGLWELNVAMNGTASIWKKGELTTEDQPAKHIRLDIQSLTALLMGYRRPSEMAQIDRIQGSEEDIQSLEKAIPVRQTYLMDFF
ncbi:GNAT family N-acetyltransferase [Paenibacillus sp. ACRRY]|uniref:GNAT family N-acetyltransferase n=1 Tax=Paenibacillus sp. ACRRY TaxID=2918208 RepID=UPI001EF46359|nr:GNAT family N-acetyltransferase [Paenibacillus sp. ACRRY]MCG7386612.1 GNAT family N-acetyltransferase [Paenibacillus sp. ACRRY]